MKVSYGITVHNEAEELIKLLEVLSKNIDDEDEIVVCVDGDDEKVEAVLGEYLSENKAIVYKRKLDGNFAEHKNSVIEKSSGDYVFHIDADEYPNEILVKQLKDKYGSKIKAYVGPTNITVTKEELDNSLASQTMRVISQTSIKEKIDPADVDDVATADDRKAADKNIIIQLRRAQDMQGKADVTFKDKPSKKEKIDIKVINKALDMFDKMRPNDKAKMQTMIGKSYRDLLKTVQRGRI